MEPIHFVTGGSPSFEARIMPNQQTQLEIPVRGMDCAGCARTVRQALESVPGVEHVDVLLAPERALVRVSDPKPDLATLRRAVEDAGYRVPDIEPAPLSNIPVHGLSAHDQLDGDLSRRIIRLFSVMFIAVVFVVLAGEVFGLFDAVQQFVPLPLGILAVLAAGYPVFRQVVRAALRGRVIAHTLMALGALAALVAGEWVTGLIVVFFMRVGEYAERFTTDQARESVRSLVRLAPQSARVVRGDDERTVPVGEVSPGDLVLVRPGERIAVDGIVVDGRAVIDQSAVTGEHMPVEALPGRKVFAATIAQYGTLRIRATAAGRDSTFGRVIAMVEEAERHRGEVQRYADRFSGYYLPIVGAIAIATYLFGGGWTAAVAVLVVACSCAFALATPAAILASIGAAAKKGLLIKGGRYVETLARADVLLVDKTGTLTLGKPEISTVTTLNGLSEVDLIYYAASADRHSEHVLADALRRLAETREIPLAEPSEFKAIPGRGVRAVIDGHRVTVGTADLSASSAAHPTVNGEGIPVGTLLYVDVDGEAAGIMIATDIERPEIADVFRVLRGFGIQQVELLTGDAEHTARDLAHRLGIAYRADLMPEDKIRIVREYQARGHTVVMIGDGVNDAPALAQADVGIAMAAGTDVAIEAAHVSLMRDDWHLVPELFRIARRTMGVVRLNIGFTAVYNIVGLTLAALGLLPPVYAAAAQSLPDLGIMTNSARLIRQ